jgi:hypothetical protein
MRDVYRKAQYKPLGLITINKKGRKAEMSNYFQKK